MSNQNSLRVTRKEACEILRVSLTTLETRIRTGEIAVVRDGKRIFILKGELERYARGENPQ